MQTPYPYNPLQFSGAVASMARVNVAAPGYSPDTDTLTRATADKMRNAIERAAVHPVVVAATVGALQDVTDWNNHTAVLGAVWEWVRARVVFVQDDDVLRATLGLPDELELLIEPPLVLSMQYPAGDCDDFTMLVGAMLLSAGIPSVEVTTIAADGADPNRWSHVYLTAHTNSGPVIVDASHGSHVGWEAPRWYRRQTWGQITAQPGAANYRTQQGAQMHGLGDMYGVGGVNWETFIPQITTGAFNLAQQITQKPGQYSAGPGGQVVSSTGGGGPSIFSGSPAGGSAVIGPGISNGMLLTIGAAVIVGLIAFKR